MSAVWRSQAERGSATAIALMTWLTLRLGTAHDVSLIPNINVVNAPTRTTTMTRFIAMLSLLQPPPTVATAQAATTAGQAHAAPEPLFVSYLTRNRRPAMNRRKLLRAASLAAASTAIRSFSDALL